MIISERIFYVMDKNKISQAELSRRTGISVKNISDWKRKKTNPNAESLLPICKALDITPNQLLTGKGIEPDYNGPDTEYEVSNSDIKILKQMHSLGDEKFKRLMAYMKALQQVARVTRMEALCNQITEALASDDVKDHLASLKAEIKELEEYYEGPAWREDFDAESLGVFPKDLKRGILTEDTLYDLLCDVDRVMEDIEEQKMTEANEK